jgi:2-phosphosulfolactate phosphatase
MMPARLNVILTPAEIRELANHDLSETTCVVFDVLRATSSIITALANGAKEIIPVEQIGDAVAIRQSRPEVLLAGERDGVRIRSEAGSGLDFDLGNSPREFTAKKVEGRSIVMTTTNGTRALRAASKSKLCLVSSFLNLHATAKVILQINPEKLLLICSGTYEGTAFEDCLGAGALCDLIWKTFSTDEIDDSSHMARRIFLGAQDDLPKALSSSWNARRLGSIPGLKDDVGFCLQRDVCDIVAILEKDGAIRKQNSLTAAAC